MNLALGAIILTLLFLPAISFRIAVNRLENLKGLLTTLSIIDSIWVFTVIPIIIHALLVLLLAAAGVTIKFDLLLHIISSSERFPLNNGTLAFDIPAFLGYNLAALFLGFLSGFVTNSLERRWRWVSRVFGLKNEWYEALEGQVLVIRNKEHASLRIDAVYIDVLANTKESSILYSGFIRKYYFKPRSSELDFLVLGHAKKRDIGNAYRRDDHHLESVLYDHDANDPVQIKGDCFIIPMKEVLNINVTYISLAVPLGVTGNAG
jgi:hypothetical protein